jgi:hypothetical protein
VNEKQIIKTILLDGEIISKVIKVSGDIDEWYFWKKYWNA